MVLPGTPPYQIIPGGCPFVGNLSSFPASFRTGGHLRPRKCTKHRKIPSSVGCRIEPIPLKIIPMLDSCSGRRCRVPAHRVLDRVSFSGMRHRSNLCCLGSEPLPRSSDTSLGMGRQLLVVSSAYEYYFVCFRHPFWTEGMSYFARFSTPGRSRRVVIRPRTDDRLVLLFLAAG